MWCAIMCASSNPRSPEYWVLANPLGRIRSRRQAKPPHSEKSPKSISTTREVLTILESALTKDSSVSPAESALTQKGGGGSAGYQAAKTPLTAWKPADSLNKYSLSRLPAPCYLSLGMISSIAAKRITSSMSSPSITSTTTTSTITATGEWRN